MAPFYGWGSTASRLEPLQGKPHSDGSIEVSHVCREDYITFQICHHEQIKVSKQSECYVKPTEKTWQTSMVTSCSVIGCNNNQNNCSYGFFHLPNVRKITPEEEDLSLERRRKLLANIRCSDLSSNQLATENSTLKICGNHFYKKQPANQQNCLKLMIQTGYLQ